MSVLGVLAATGLFGIGLALHLLLCAVALGLGAGGMRVLGGWLVADGRQVSLHDALRQPWWDWRAQWRKQRLPSMEEARFAPLCHAASLLLAAAGIVLIPGFVRVWPDGAGVDLLVLVALPIGSRLVANLPALEPGIAADALGAERTLRDALVELVPIGALMFALAQMGGSTGVAMLPGLARSGASAPAALPLALVSAIIAIILLAAGEFANSPLDRQISGPDRALMQAASALRRLAWLMLIALILPPAPSATAAWSLVADWPAAMAVWAIKLLVAALAVSALRASSLGPDHRRGAALLFATLAALLVFASGRLA